MQVRSLQASGPSKAPSLPPADIMNILTARAGAITRANTLFLAGVGGRVDWVANLGNAGRRVGRFSVEQYTSSEFNESSQGSNAWLGNPQAVGHTALLKILKWSLLLRLSLLSGHTQQGASCHPQGRPAYQLAPAAAPKDHLDSGRLPQETGCQRHCGTSACITCAGTVRADIKRCVCVWRAGDPRHSHRAGQCCGTVGVVWQALVVYA